MEFFMILMNNLFKYLSSPAICKFLTSSLIFIFIFFSNATILNLFTRSLINLIKSTGEEFIVFFTLWLEESGEVSKAKFVKIFDRLVISMFIFFKVSRTDFKLFLFINARSILPLM